MEVENVKVIMAHNCVQYDVKEMQTIEFLKYPYIDLRYNMVSDNDTLDFEEYFNYVEMSKQFVRDAKTVKGGFLLDIGYIPVWMPPTFLQSYTKMVTKCFVGIPYLAYKSVSFNNPKYEGDSEDIWVSKVTCAEKFGWAYEDITVKKFWKELLK